MNRRSILVAGVVVLLVVVGYRTMNLTAINASRELAVAVIYDPDRDLAETGIRAAYDTYFDEQGVPHTWISNRDFALLDGAASARHYVAIVIVDHLNRFVPSQTIDVLTKYLRAGGSIAVIADAGTRSRRNRYLRKAALADLTAVDYLALGKNGAVSLLNGPLRFSSADLAKSWRVPQGKLTKNATLSTYGYPVSTFPLQAARSTGAIVIASSGVNVGVARRRAGNGTVVYINIPLGAMRSTADAFPMHALLGTFLYDIAKVPHLVPSPDGIGHLIIDFHIDSSIEYRGIPNLVAHHFLRRDVPMEFDVTAGPDRDASGDHLGFDACGKGRPFLRTLMNFGAIGSHGGWAHNEFASNVENKKLNSGAMQDLVRKNNDCLYSQTHRSVLGYAAPAGAHPQPDMTLALQHLGMNAYYYAGDSAAPAERAFKDGKMISPTVWAFPVLPNKRLASLGEMRIAKESPAEINRWLDSSVDYTIADRSIHLIYSHAYDLLYKPYQAPFSRFLDKIARATRTHQLQTGGLADAANFMTRFLGTTYAFSRDDNNLVFTADNSQGLQGLAFAIPRDNLPVNFRVPAGLVARGHDKDFLYFDISSHLNHVQYSFPRRNS